MRYSLIALLAALSIPAVAQAHFQELLPDADVLPVTSKDAVSLSAVFTHPAEGGPVMDMGQPKRVGVIADGKKRDLSAALEATTIDGKRAFKFSYKPERPGDYVFFLEPAPYWDAAEKHFLVHYTKVVVDFGGGEGWDAPVGFPVEIRPLTRPYGLWTGNLFHGVAFKDGKPMPHAMVEVTWVNQDAIAFPSDVFATQVVKTDAQGIFAYAIPHAGWWGFNALTEGNVKGPDGKPAKAEMGGTIWVKATDFPKTKQ